MPLPPYIRTNRCPTCGHGIYIPEKPADGIPPVMSACPCAWLKESVRTATATPPETLDKDAG